MTLTDMERMELELRDVIICAPLLWATGTFHPIEAGPLVDASSPDYEIDCQNHEHRTEWCGLGMLIRRKKYAHWPEKRRYGMAG